MNPHDTESSKRIVLAVLGFAITCVIAVGFVFAITSVVSLLVGSWLRLAGFDSFNLHDPKIHLCLMFGIIESFALIQILASAADLVESN